MQRKGNARWQGTTQEGSGTLSVQSGTLHDTPYSFKARFGDGKGTNPEELLGVLLDVAGASADECGLDCKTHPYNRESPGSKSVTVDGPFTGSTSTRERRSPMSRRRPSRNTR
jgi:osmotically inducible protein OsmC